MSDLSVNSILDASGGATTTINGFTPTVSNMAGRNRIINGDMRIDQRNAGAAVTGSDNYYLDRFLAGNGTGTGAIQTQQSTLGNSKSIKTTATTAVTTLATGSYVRGVETRVEAQNIFDLNSKAFTISFKVETNWTGNLAVRIRANQASRSYVVDAAVVSGVNAISTTIQFEAGSLTANDSSLGIALTIGFNNEAAYQTATTGSWIAGDFYCSTSSTQWAKTTGNFINITDLQLEEGSVATPFEHRQYGQELALCQRYYEHFTGSAVYNPIASSGMAWSSTNTANHIVSFLVNMRAPPTLLQSGLSIYSPNIGGKTATIVLGTGPTTSGCELITNSSTGLVNGDSWYIATGSGFIAFSAEL